MLSIVTHINTFLNQIVAIGYGYATTLSVVFTAIPQCSLTTKPIWSEIIISSNHNNHFWYVLQLVSMIQHLKYKHLAFLDVRECRGAACRRSPQAPDLASQHLPCLLHNSDLHQHYEEATLLCVHHVYCICITYAGDLLPMSKKTTYLHTDAIGAIATNKWITWEQSHDVWMDPLRTATSTYPTIL